MFVRSKVYSVTPWFLTLRCDTFPYHYGDVYPLNKSQLRLLETERGSEGFEFRDLTWVGADEQKRKDDLSSTTKTPL